MDTVYGSFECKLDPQGRITVPAVLRDAFEKIGDTWVLTIDYQSPCIALFPYARWLDIAKGINQMPMTHRLFRDIKRRMLGNAREIKRDKSARLTVPPLLRDLAGIDNACILVSLATHYELWSLDSWRTLNEAPIPIADIPEALWRDAAQHLAI